VDIVAVLRVEVIEWQRRLEMSFYEVVKRKMQKMQT
jgi:hypothetical protein